MTEVPAADERKPEEIIYALFRSLGIKLNSSTKQAAKGATEAVGRAYVIAELERLVAIVEREKPHIPPADHPSRKYAVASRSAHNQFAAALHGRIEELRDGHA